MSDYHRTVPFGAGWLFGAYTGGSERPGFDDSALAPVTLPHTVAPLSWQDWDPASSERAWVYRKRFDAPPGHHTALPAAMICANLDRLEVYVDGEHVATLTPDRAGYPHLAYPPSFADFRAVDGSVFPELRIDGYLGDGQVASRYFSSDPSGDVLALAADHAEIDADGADATRLEFRAADRYGAPRPYVTGQVTLAVEGPAILVGESPFDFAARIRVRRR